MREINKEIADYIAYFLAEVANRKLNLTDEMINKEEDSGVRKILFGLKLLNEDLVYSKKEAHRAVKLESQKRKLQERIILKEKTRVRQLKLTRDKLIQANDELAALTHVTSHDLQEPIVSIISSAQILKEDYYSMLDEKGRIFLSSLSNSATRLRNQIQAVQDYSRLGIEPIFSDVCLDGLIGNAKSDLGTVLNNKWVRFTIGEMPLRIYCLPYELKMLFKNLIHNAIKYNESDIKQIKLNCKAGDNYYGGF